MGELVALSAPGVVSIDEARRSKVIAKTSASQIDSYERCPRYWFNSYVLGLRQPPTPAQLRGTAIDLEVQHYLKTGEVRPNQEWFDLVHALKAHLPAPGAHLMVQASIELPTYNGGPMLVGYPDLAWWVNAPRGRLNIDDLKSISDFRYCKTREQLADNTQMIVYARWGYEVLDAYSVAVAHVYGRTRGAARAHRVPLLAEPSIVVTRGEVEERWGRRMDTVREMVAAARGAQSAEELEPHTDACEMYGGCPFRQKCGLNAFSVAFGRRGGGTTMDATTQTGGLLARLQAAKQQGGAVTGAPTVAPPTEVMRPEMEVKPEPSSIDAQAAVEDARARIAAGKLRLDGSGQVFVPEGADNGWIMRTPTEAEKAALIMSNLPPVTATLPTAPGAAPAASPPPPVSAPGAVLPPDAPSRTSTPEEVAAVEAGARKRGRPKKDTSGRPTVKCPTCGDGIFADEFALHFANHSKSVAVAPPAASGQLAEHPAHTMVRESLVSDGRVPLPSSSPSVIASAPVPAPPTEKLQAEVEGVRKAVRKAPPVAPALYVDCVPTKGSTAVISLEEWLAPIAEIAAAAHETQDYRLISYTSKGVLAVAIRECLDTCPPALLIDSRMSGAEIALEVLIPHAAIVVRGVR